MFSTQQSWSHKQYCNLEKKKIQDEWFCYSVPPINYYNLPYLLIEYKMISIRDARNILAD